MLCKVALVRDRDNRDKEPPPLRVGHRWLRRKKPWIYKTYFTLSRSSLRRKVNFFYNLKSEKIKILFTGKEIDFQSGREYLTTPRVPVS